MAQSFENKLKELDEQIKFTNDLVMRYPNGTYDKLYLYFTQKRAELASSIGKRPWQNDWS